ncbi:DUF2959 domain-containing protein [Paraneptunicella aestuarii]|uniref:DUF2959 domain-containing protein n=1 Tax=Paraneptunicella aestuarii TaxID=2831148 RepID=UPI001E542A8C|nr:DUF2959 domain-containing protein [Paraneptunicella aestuarii]UAA38654.1 DUF2959 domain-containing protein [Paraneptunicella aestuarii]
MIRIILFSLFFTLAGCQSAYYSAWEKLGVEKRDILADRVESAKSAQEEAQEQFTDALERLSTLISFHGGELQDTYEALKDQYESSKSSAERVGARIDSIEDVAEALFDEWSTELEQYNNESLRRKSEQQLHQTQRRYQRLLATMRKAEASMNPVLATLQDNVLYLKHNLNASAVGALQGEFENIKKDIEQLIKEMNNSIAQSDEFISLIKQN